MPPAFGNSSISLRQVAKMLGLSSFGWGYGQRAVVATVSVNLEGEWGGILPTHPFNHSLNLALVLSVCLSLASRDAGGP